MENQLVCHIKQQFILSQWHAKEHEPNEVMTELDDDV